MGDRIYLTLFRVFRFFTLKTPKSLQRVILKSLAKFLKIIDREHKRVAKINLDFAFKDSIDEDRKSKIIDRCYENLLFYMADFVKNQGISKEELERKIKFKNRDILENLLKKREKVILVTAHYGNWELLSLAISALITPLSIVGRSLDSRVMQEILKVNREQFGIELIDKNGASRGLIKALNRDRVVGILVDQNVSKEFGILVDFFQENSARHTTIASLLSRKFQAKIVPVFIQNDREYLNYTVEFKTPIEPLKSEDSKRDIFELTQAQAKVTEEVIRERADEWFWFHRRWKSKHREIYKRA